MSHVHITHKGQIYGTLSLDENGHVVDDGSPAAINAIDHTNHGHKREHGQAALDAIVRHLDSSTLVGAHHCDEDHGHADEHGRHKERSRRDSTEPTPQDAWPDWGELNNDQSRHDIQWGDSGHGLVE